MCAWRQSGIFSPLAPLWLHSDYFVPAKCCVVVYIKYTYLCGAYLHLYRVTYIKSTHLYDFSVIVNLRAWKTTEKFNVDVISMPVYIYYFFSCWYINERIITN